MIVLIQNMHTLSHSYESVQKIHAKNIVCHNLNFFLVLRSVMNGTIQSSVYTMIRNIRTDGKYRKFTDYKQLYKFIFDVHGVTWCSIIYHHIYIGCSHDLF